MNLGGLAGRAIPRSARLLPSFLLFSALVQARAPLVLLTDFGTRDGAVSAMKGVRLAQRHSFHRRRGPGRGH